MTYAAPQHEMTSTSSARTKEHTDKQGYWNGELRSLGIDPKKKNDLNDNKELKDLTDNVKQTMYQDYKTAYSKDNSAEDPDSRNAKW